MIQEKEKKEKRQKPRACSLITTQGEGRKGSSTTAGRSTAFGGGGFGPFLVVVKVVGGSRGS